MNASINPLAENQNRCRPSNGQSITSRRFRMPAWLIALFASVACFVPAVRAATLVQEFYLPMPEAQIYSALNAIQPGISNAQASIYSVVVTGNGTAIYYDQWEDGYETDLANPTQGSTLIWGDGNDANGITPGFAHDPASLTNGTVITLANNVPLPRNPSVLLYDGRDRIAASKAIVVTHAGWPVSPGPVYGGAVSVLSTIDYGTNYISPVGQDLTNKLFGYVGMFVMAAQDGTSVTIDTDGPGTNAPTSLTLNRGESYLINGGVKKGGRVTASKPVQADLIIGHVGGSYAADWFTLVSVEQWDNTYYTPVGSSASGNPAYVYLYNANTNAITINYNTRVGSGSFSVPGTNGVYQFTMPASSGASFTSASGQNFFPLCTVGANPASDTAYNWGFTLLPKDALTTEAIVGWAPGSADGTVNGSPVWITPLATTTIYVDYNGDHNGPLTDPNGNKYDTNYSVAALESKKVFDPDKNQTGMRLYTINGALLSAAWGEDPDTAAPGNPYIDAGTTVLPFPVPVLKKTSTIYTDIAPTGLSIGDTLEYTVELDNRGLLPLGNTVVIDALPTNMVSYVTNSTTWNSNAIPDGTTGTKFPLDESGYTIPVILRGGTSTFKFRAVTLAAGNITNIVSAVGYSLSASAVITPPAGGGSTQCGLNFANAAGTTVVSYVAGTNIFVRLTDADANTSSGSAQTVSVAVRNLTSGDIETITLTETGNNTGIFQNSAALPSSVSAGLFQQDGTLNVTPGDALNVAYTDPVYADACSGSAVIQVPALTKVLYLSGTNSPDQGLDRIDPVATSDNTTAQSGILALGTSTITTGGTFATGVTSTATITLPCTVAAGTNRLLMVSVSYISDQANRTVSSVTYGGQSLTQKATQRDGGDELVADIWYLVNPGVGTSNVVVTLSSSAAGATVSATSFAGVNPATPLGTAATAQLADSSGTSNPTVTVTSATNELVFDAVARDNTGTLTVNSTQTQLTNLIATGQVRGGSSTKPGAASVTMIWTNGATDEGWAIAAVSIKPASGGGGGTNSATFTQSPTFCANFTMPSNSVVSVTNFVTVTSGSLTASPAVTATLRYGATTIAHLTNAAYNSTSNWIIWSGILSSNVTVPSGQTISLIVSNNDTAAFRIDYDSAAKPSKIALPTTTVINVDTFAVYDAPYPGGSVVTAPTAGSLLYVRATVSDPFGAYDITSLGLTIDGSGTTYDIATNLNSTKVVASDSCSKTYEFVWQTGSAPGGFNLSATANEGTEGINDSATASLTLTFLDLGTPSTTTFTSGDNGPATNSFAANTNVCVRVNDSDQNTNSATVDLISVTITSSSGDSETLTLVETGTNSGIFTGCSPASTSSGSSTNNGTLNAPVGSVLTVNYVDPTDPTDTSSANGSVLPAPNVPGIAVSKTLVTPADGQAGIGEALQYNIQVVNSGSTTLTNIAVTDTFPAASMTFVSASVTPNVIGSGTLSWTNLGIFTPGQSVTLTVNFTAAAVAASAINSATANGPGATNTDTAAVTITRSALTITKSLLNPTNGPVPIGSNITYRITVLNSGSTSIPTLPLEDTFSAAQLQFVSATNLAPDGTGAGSLLWNDITGAGSLAASNTITIDVTMKVVGSGAPTLNEAHADYAVDQFGNPVPTATSSVGITTGAARITGNVYNDADQSGTLTGGDTGLSGVTVQLYTDPNADGNPADGTLLRLITTGAAGDYELLNLTTGRYVVVESDLPGYASSFPANNRLALNITGLTTNAGQNFFDFIPAVTNYATIGGSVWNDTNASGVKDLAETGLASVNLDLVQDVNTNGLVDIGEPVAASTTTGTNGAYTFGGIVPGNYVIRETDLSGYVSTGDSRPPNDNQISVTVSSGAVTNSNDFLDYFAGSLPVAVSDTATTPEDTAILLNVLTNDFDLDGDTLVITNATTTNGFVTIIGGTNLLFLPATNFNGSVTFSYTITDNRAGSSNATVTVTVTSINDAPVANSQSVTNNEDTALPITLTGSDVDGPVTNFVLGTLPTHGTLSGSGANVTYTPTNNYNGPDFFTFTINDGSLTSAVATVSITVTPVNDPPVAVNDNVTVNEDSTNSIPVLVNDTDPDGNPLTIASLTSTNGTATIVGTNVVYTPSSNFFGTNVMTYCVTDGSATNCATITVTVLAVNDAPVANNQSITIPEDTLTNLVLTASDVDSSNLTFSIVSGPASGALGILNTNSGAVSYLPSTNYNGADSFTFRVFDGSLYATGTVSITVLPVNDAPFANSQSVTNNEDTALPITLTGSDVDGPVTNFVLGTLPTHGTLSGSGANLTYTPTNNYNGPDSFTFTINDGSLTSAVATVSITVLPVNDAPTANSQSVTNNEDTALPITLTGSDVDGPVTNFVLVTLPTHGTLSGSGANLTYTPTNNYNGPDAFTFTVNDGSLTSAVATVTITVTPVNDAPAANNQSVTFPEDTSTNLVLTASDVDSSNLVYSILSGPTHGTTGTLNTNTGAVTYSPSNNYAGPDSFTFTVFDGSLYATGIVSITVTPINDAPIADNQSITIPEDTSTNLVLTASDVDSSNLVYSILSDPMHGTLGLLNTNTGAVTYSPSNNYAGPDGFTFTVFDGSLYATGTVSITVTPVNDAPVANSQSVTNNEDTALPITLTGSDVDGPVTNFVLISLPTHGTLSGSGANLTYTPTNNYNGPDSFTFTVNDGSLTSAVATVSITVLPVNDAPAATNLSVTINEDTSTNLVVSGSDVDNTNLTFAILVGPANGTLGTLNTNSGAVAYSPSNNFNGADSFTFTVFDGSLYATGTVSITVLPVNDAPVAVNDSVTMNEDTTNTIPVLVNDTDPDGNPLTIVSVTSTNGTATIVGTNVVYTPPSNFFGTNVMTYCVTDGTTTNCATITVIVTPVNDAPVANNLNVTIPEDTLTNLVLTASDVDNTNLTFSIVSGPANGSLGILNTNSGAVSYLPSTNYNGADSFTFRVFDGSLYATGTVSITVTPQNDAPFANSQSVTNLEDTALPITLTGSDVDGPVTNFVLGTLPTHGTLSGSGANLTYTPTNNYNGPDSFTFTINDGSLTSAVATVSITVLPVNDAPVAVNDSYGTFKNVPLNIGAPGVLANDTDVDSSLTAALATNVTHGTLLLNTNGSFTYTPSNNYVGPDSFAYLASDGITNALAIVSLTISATNTAPVANNDSYSVNEDNALTVPVSGVLTNDTDVDADTLIVTVVATTTNGVLALNANGSFTYTPNTNFVGVDTFTYLAHDSFTNSGVATVTITVNAVNDAPAATNLSVTINEDTSTNLVVTGSDVDNTNRTFAVLTPPTHGTLGTLNTNSGAVTYSPSNNYVGPDSFTFTVFDGSLYATGTVSITVLPVNDPPVAVNDNATVNEDSTNSIPVLVNDTDPDGNPLTIVSVASTNGTATFVGTNVVYTPSSNFFGTNVMTYCVTDGAVTNCATITVIVTPVNDAPFANSQSVTNNEDTALPITLTGSDVDGPVTNFVLVSLPTHGTLSGSGANLTYTPTNNYNGPDNFTFTVNDGSLTSLVATVSITVLPVNDPPVAVNDSYSVFQGAILTVLAGGVLTNDTDVESNALTAVFVSNPAHGTLTLLTNGGFTYTPTNTYAGPDSFTYRASDGVSNSSTATVFITVVPQADIAVTKTGPATVTPGVNFNYTIIVTNFGPGTASNVMTFDSLPTNLTFVTASSGGVLSNNIVRWPTVTNFARGSVTNYTITVTTPTNGSFVNVAYATSTTADPDSSNNDGSANASRVSTLAAPVSFGVRQGTNVFNPQTGLYEQTVNVTNLSGSTVAAFQVLVGNIRGTNGVARTNVWLWNATGTNVDTRRYVQYNSPLDPGSNATVRLEFYNPLRTPFTNDIEILATLPTPAVTNLSGGVVIDRAFTNSINSGSTRFVIEWTSIPGRNYTVIYGPSVSGPWTAATPTVNATATRVQWYDDGPPKTSSKPLNGGSRYYRVILNP